MGGQVKDLIVLVELSLIPFSFIFEIQQSVQVILIQLVLFHLESKREWITPGFKKWGTLTFFFNTVFLNFIRGHSKIYSWLV